MKEMGLPPNADALFQGGVHDDDAGYTFDDLELEIEPYSMERANEGLAQKRALEMHQILMNSLPAMAQYPDYPWQDHFAKIGNAMNAPDMSDDGANASGRSTTRRDGPKYETTTMTRRTFVWREGEVVEKVAAQTEDGMLFSVAPDIGFQSYQLPRNWKHHKDAGGEFAPDGKPIFGDRKQIEESMARARGEEGTTIEYNEL